MPYLAGVALDDEHAKALALTVAMPDVPITDTATGITQTPADDLPDYITRALGLDPLAITDQQRAAIRLFIAAHTL